MEPTNPIEPKKPRRSDKLNPRSRSFAEKVAAGLDATSAYLEAGYTSSTRKNAQRASWRLGEKPAVAAYIQELRAAAAAKSKAEATLTIEDKLAYLVRAIKTGAGSLTGQDELCQHFRQYSDGSTSVRTPCKIRAIKLHSELSNQLDSKKDSRDSLQELVDEIRRGHKAPFGTRSRASVDEPEESVPQFFCQAENTGI